ncbi:HNH endonuclease [Hathewaya histolytica]|uniref:HNH endonuclease n=1 Tax=Hathewaya histolytica TaxID=1498 RepID=A0A4U9R9I1_HATHI|nr:HNH endonuclease [Hathewaya histolytica]VTQ86823.1 HNH endonuclease [Hathewaya histolytica]
MCRKYTQKEKMVIQKIKHSSNICFYCKRELTDTEITVDHVVPICRGGKTEENNLVISCHSCNSKKGDMTLEEFLLYLKVVKQIRINFLNKLPENKLCFNPLTKNEFKLLQEFKNYTITEDVFNYYINNVKNNKEEDFNTIRKKLIRNIILGKINKNVSYYGNLIIEFSLEEKTIVSIKNRKQRAKPPKKDKKKWLNIELNLINSTFPENLKNIINIA